MKGSCRKWPEPPGWFVRDVAGIPSDAVVYAWPLGRALRKRKARSKR